MTNDHMAKTARAAMNKSRRGFCSRHWCWGIVVTSAVLAAVAFGEIKLQVDGVIPANALAGRDAVQSVYVRDSAVAVEKLALAHRLEGLKEWDKSADVYMEILRGYADRVVPAQVDSGNKIYQYKSVAFSVQERLAKWPAPGLSAFRARYQQDAESLLAQAGDDPVQLHRVIALYLVTDSAKEAALRLIDLYFETGEFAAAAWLGDRLLMLHPALGDDRAKLLFRAGLSHQLAGNSNQAKARLEQLQRDVPDALGNVGGQDINLAQTLHAELSKPQPTHSAIDSWPSSFGSNDRSTVPSVPANFGARVYSIELPKSAARNAMIGRTELESSNKNDRIAGTMTGIFPVVDRGEMFFQDNARVYAVNVDSGTPLPGWAETYSGDRGGRYSLPAWSTPRGLQSTLALTDDAVYAVMALPDIGVTQYTNIVSPRGDSRLVCLDRATGLEKWVLSSRNLPRELGLGRNLDFSGCPVIVGDTIYVMGRGGKGQQFEDSYVLAFDAGTGKTRWITYLASASTGLPDFADPSGSFVPRVSQLSFWGGRLYALSNIGALAALDAYDGTIVWLNLYPRDLPDVNQNPNVQWQRVRNRANNPLKPWQISPVIISGGHVFVLPSDGLHVLIYDAATGVEKKRIDLSSFESANTLLAVVNQKLILASKRTIFCVNWPAYDPKREQTENLVWRSLSFSKAQFPDDAIRGRGFVTHDAVVVPTAWGLHRVSLNSGRHEAIYPPTGSDWAEGESAGNVLVTGDHLVVAGPERVNVYTDMAMAMAKLDSEVAAAPHQPEPRLRYAEVMSVAGKWDLALQKLDEAMSLLEGAGMGASAVARDRLFADAMLFAQRVAKDESGGKDLARAFFDRAAVAARTPSQQVSIRLTRAKAEKPTLSAKDELALYQQIVQDPQMREVSVSGEQGVRPAGLVAERAIADLIARAGREVYAEFDTAAAAALEAAGKDNQPPGFLTVAKEYPNAKVAPQALRLAAEAYEAQNDPRLAAQMLRLLLFKYPQVPERAEVIESLARNYLALPNRVEVAIARLAQGATIDRARLSQPLKLPDGRVLEANVSFTDALEALREFHRRSATEHLPDLNLPPMPPPEKFKLGQSKFLPPAPDSVIPDVTALIVPPPPFDRNDRIITYIEGRGVCVFEPLSVAPLFASEALSKPPASGAWVGNSLLIWNDQEIVALNADDGSTQWKTAVSGLPQAEVVPGPAGFDQQADATDADPGADDPDALARAEMLGENIQLRGGGRLIVRGNAQLLVNRRGQIVGRRAMLANLQPQAQLAAEVVAGPEQIKTVRPLSDRVVFCTSEGRIVAVDLNDGKVLWQTRPSERGPTHFLANDDFVAMRLDDAANVSLLVLDALSGQFISRRNFTPDQPLLNVALAADGTLVWIFPDRLCGKDLFEPGDRLTFEVMGGRDRNSAIFAGAILPEHLQVADGRIFVLSDNGSQVRVFSLETGKPLRNGDNDIFLSTGARAGSTNIVVRPFGRRLYVVGSNTLMSYDLENLAYNQQAPLESQTTLRPRDLIVTKNYVLVVAEPGARIAGRNHAQRASNTLRLLPVSRAPLDDTGREIGLLEEQQIITGPAAIQSWQAVNGGFYYLSGDRKLHFLKGAGRS